VRRVLVTGSRNYDDKNTLFDALADQYEPGMIVVHGGARGADTIACEWVKKMQSLGYQVTTEVHQADWYEYGKAAGPIRNEVMVDAGADVCLAFPLGESRGTRHCMSAAEKAGIPVINLGERDQ
jgi:hypothetical protein